MPPSPRRRSLFILLAAALLGAAYSQSTTTFPNCDRTFSCGDITNVGFPFTGGDRPSHCGLPEFALTCRDNSITELTDDSVAYRVLRIDQTQKTLILSRSDLYNNTCPPEFRNAALNTTLFSYRGPQNEDLTLFYGCNRTAMTINPYNLFRCNSSRFNFTDAYYIIGPVPNDPILRIIDCSVNFRVALLRAVGNQLANRQLTLQQALMQGFSVNYTVPHERWCSDCKKSGGECGFDSVRGQPVCICDNTPCPVPLTPPPAVSQDAPPPSEGHQRSLKGIIVGLVVGSTCIILVFIIIYWYLKRGRSPTRSNQECSPNLEKILHEQGSLAPKRYKYSEIKKITKSFSHKLGQGGYRNVYKGMLANGSLVAVKVLFETKGNGEEFINEVDAISKTSHVNIVNLLGFCYDRSKRALVYEFMPNKSLDKFISNGGSSSAACHLDLGKLYKIAIGVARGLEYLHTGCTTRIVHFDIKPQNILLDEDFSPKISDFGLAKLCKKKESVVSMLIARGTVGYIAPEMFYYNFGGVSHKSDVYSYGMMVLEMVGAKNGSETKVVQSSENYFPDRIYEQVILDITKIEEYAMIEEEEERAKKMFLVGFWCIQTNPSDRPSMTKVVEMLQGSLQAVQIPPKPFLFCPKLSSRQLSSLLSMHVETERAT